MSRNPQTTSRLKLLREKSEHLVYGSQERPANPRRKCPAGRSPRPPHRAAALGGELPAHGVVPGATAGGGSLPPVGHRRHGRAGPPPCSSSCSPPCTGHRQTPPQQEAPPEGRATRRYTRLTEAFSPPGSLRLPSGIFNSSGLCGRFLRPARENRGAYSGGFPACLSYLLADTVPPGIKGLPKPTAQSPYLPIQTSPSVTGFTAPR